jgi:hypothetical protein
MSERGRYRPLGLDVWHSGEGLYILSRAMFVVHRLGYANVKAWSAYFSVGFAGNVRFFNVASNCLLYVRITKPLRNITALKSRLAIFLNKINRMSLKALYQ